MAVQRKLVTLMAIAAIFIEVTMAATYTVGDPGSWDLQTDLTTWASTKTFYVGDNLLFSYGPTHNVLEVTKADYDSCVSSNPITSDSSGSTTLTLASPTKRYFICGISNHCQNGMKVEIDTQATSTPPPATPGAPPPASPPPATPGTPPPASPKTSPLPAAPGAPPPASPKPSPPGVSPISPISPSTPPTSNSAVPPTPTGSGLAPPPPNGASAPKSGLHITLAMGGVGIVMFFLSL